MKKKPIIAKQARPIGFYHDGQRNVIATVWERSDGLSVNIIGQNPAELRDAFEKVMEDAKAGLVLRAIFGVGFHKKKKVKK